MFDFLWFYGLTKRTRCEPKHKFVEVNLRGIQLFSEQQLMTCRWPLFVYRSTDIHVPDTHAGAMIALGQQGVVVVAFELFYQRLCLRVTELCSVQLGGGCADDFGVILSATRRMFPFELMPFAQLTNGTAPLRSQTLAVNTLGWPSAKSHTSAKRRWSAAFLLSSLASGAIQSASFNGSFRYRSNSACS